MATSDTTDRSSSDDPPVTHYFDDNPSVASSERRLDLTLPDVSLALTTDRGVFSADKIDVGTKLLLLDGPPPSSEDRVLVDVGAGYGPIALTLAARNPSAVVWAVDVNRRARQLCRRNAEANQLVNIRVAAPEEVPADLVVDRLWSNPPVRIGKAALYQLIDLWLARLAPEGSTHLVMQKHLGADSLHRRLESQGWSVTRRRSRKAYRLLDVTHREAG